MKEKSNDPSDEIEFSDFGVLQNALLSSIIEDCFIIEEPESDAFSEEEVYYIPPFLDEELATIPLFEEEDRDILMYRDIHCGQNFDIMLEHLKSDIPLVQLQFSEERIEELKKMQALLKTDLSPLVLRGKDQEKVVQMKKLYTKLGELYTNYQGPDKEVVTTFCDIILEENKKESIDRAILLRKKIEPFLLFLIRSPLFFDPFSPGYGLAPAAALTALGSLHCVKALPHIFSLIGTSDFEIETAALQALTLLGDEAKKFCLKVFASHPVTQDNEKALIALLGFGKEVSLYATMLEKLSQLDIEEKSSFFQYITVFLEELDEADQKLFSDKIVLLPEKFRKLVRKKI